MVKQDLQQQDTFCWSWMIAAWFQIRGLEGGEVLNRREAKCLTHTELATVETVWALF